MIIFELDGVLADIEHRRHFVDSSRPHPTIQEAKEFMRNGCIWKPDWQAFYEASDQDEPIVPVIELFTRLSLWDWNIYEYDVQIWTGRCESVREKTKKWLERNDIYYKKLKMRPIGDDRPAHVIKEEWLNEYLGSKVLKTKEEDQKYMQRGDIRMVFDSDPESIEMYRRYGIFVFDCCQDINMKGK